MASHFFPFEQILHSVNSKASHSAVYTDLDFLYCFLARPDLWNY